MNGRERGIVRGAGESLVPFRYLGRLPNLVGLLFSGVFMGPREATLSGLREGWSTAAGAGSREDLETGGGIWTFIGRGAKGEVVKAGTLGL